jgi:molybdopterin molybdotransferase
MALMPIDQALDRLLDGLQPLASERIDLESACARVMAQPVTAPCAYPFEDNSAMDGYALEAGPGPWRVVGESAAGHPFDGNVLAGQAVRIFTGAVVPAGTDTILIQEEAQQTGDQLVALSTPTKGRHIRRSGSDLQTGQRLLAQGQTLDAAALSALAGLGLTQVDCRRQPRLVIFATGDELQRPGTTRRHGQIYESNGAYLHLAARLAGAEVLRVAQLPDRRAAIDTALQQAIEDADLVLLSGGVSVGDHDLVGVALKELAGDLTFYKVAMKPGKPVAAARLQHCTLLGLPGNPASTLVSFEIFARPVIRTLAGSSTPHRRLATAPCQTTLSAGGSRSEFLRARLGDHGLLPHNRQGSGDLSSLLGVDALVMRPSQAPPSLVGDQLPYLALSGPGSSLAPEAQWAKMG